MTQAMIKTAHRPSWIDLSSNDASGSRAFYSRLFDWKVDVNPDPQYGGYGRATVHGRDAAGITPTQSIATWRSRGNIPLAISVWIKRASCVTLAKNRRCSSARRPT